MSLRHNAHGCGFPRIPVVEEPHGRLLHSLRWWAITGTYERTSPTPSSSPLQLADSSERFTKELGVVARGSPAPVRGCE